MRLACDIIEATKSTQIRKVLDHGVIDDYCEALKNGAIFPAIDVFKEKGSSRYILADGFHRLIAHIHAERAEIECNVREGGMREALEFAFGANSMHGLRRTNADKRHAVELALKDPYFGQLKRQEVADLCRVTVRTVLRIANQLAVDGDDDRTLSDRSNGNQSQEPTDDDIRPTKKPPTQEKVERDELRQALGLIMALPYGGEDTEKLDLSLDDIKHINFCIDWLTEALEAYAAAQYKPDADYDSENRMAIEQ